MLKRIGAFVLAAMMIGTTFSVSAATYDTQVVAEQEADLSGSTGFDPQTVMWTNNPIENVLADAGVYTNAAEVNPNADNKTSIGVQSPYGKSGENLTGWAYSEFCWTNSYPVGNGRMAGMVAGGIDKEVIQINEDTCWDGSPYGTLQDENGNTLSTLAQTSAVDGKINTVDPTSGSKVDGWKYFRGANEDGTPAAIGSSGVLVGDEAFRTNYPDFANKSISNQALSVNNAHSTSAVQQRYSMERMVESTVLGNPTGQRAYKSFVEVYLDFAQDHNKVTNYTKSLDMKTGIVTVEYDYNGSHFKRETLASYPDQVVATHVESDSDLDFNAELHSYHESDTYSKYEKVSDNEVKIISAVSNGNKDNNLGRVNAIKFEARMFLDGDGTFTVSDDNKSVSVKGGKTADIYVVGATNYVDYLTLDNEKPSQDCDKYETNVKKRNYDEIKTRHIADFSPEFEKTALSIDNTSKYTTDNSTVPTEKRVRMDVNGKSGFTVGSASRTSDANKNGVYSTYSKGDNQLAALEFNYGKYLILAGSRAGRTATSADEIDIPESQPLNLTGKWSAGLSASWNGKYTININTEMNYWATQPLNIADSERPLIDTFDDLAKSGAITAANQYAIYNDRGDDTYQPGDPWVMHHNFDLWRGTQPIDNATAGLWPTGGSWLLDHAWQYYQFTNDTEYLAEVYPYMVGAAKFFTQFLVVDPQTGYLITAASCSPEQGGVQPGPAMDTQLVRNLYDMVEQASAILGKQSENSALLSKIDEQMPSTYLADEQGKIAPNIIDSNGLINEWERGDVGFDFSVNTSSGKYTVTNPFNGNATAYINEHTASNNSGHRHCSNLWELFPGTHLSAYSDDANEQKIYKAYQKSTSARGTGSGQGWGLAWRINLNARAHDGNASSTMLEQLFTTRTSPNLFDQHPNFQIDGNYGATSGIIEMLVQSHDGSIELLPALPDNWKSGSYSGFNTREGATVDLSWKDSKPSEATVHATRTGDLNIRSKYMASAKVYDENGTPVPTTLNADANLLTFAAQEGMSYTIDNFGTNVVEGDRTYKAADATDFFASNGGTSVPKIANGTEVGYLYNISGVKMGYALKDVDFDGLKSLKLKMASVRYGDTYAMINVDKKDGTEIANQIITTGDNELELKNMDGITGTHTVYISFIQNPYDGDSSHKYLGNASDLVAHYSQSVNPEPTTNPTEAPEIATYEITKAQVDENGKLDVELKYNGTEENPAAKLIVGAYDKDDESVMLDSSMFDVNGTTIENLDYTKPENSNVKVYIWDGTQQISPLGNAEEATLGSATAEPVATATPSAEPTNPPATAEPTDTPASAEPTATIDPTATETPAPTKAPVKSTYKVSAVTNPGSVINSIDGIALTVGAENDSQGTTFTYTADAKTINNVTYVGYSGGNQNAKYYDGTLNNTPSLENLPNTGAFYKFDTTKAGQLEIALRWDCGRPLNIIDATNSTYLSDAKTGNEYNGYKESETTGNTIQKYVTVNLEADSTYYFFLNGSKPGLYGFSYTVGGASDPTETTTPAETAKPTGTPGPTVDPALAYTVDGTKDTDVEAKTYKTVREAVAAVEANAPTSEEDRAYINVMPGTYREQVVVTKPYITLQKAPSSNGEVVLTWYYGCGSMYDSCNASGMYDPSAIGDGVSYAPQHWGATLNIEKNAKAFISKDITVENSYNRYYTQEELTDLTQVDPNTGNSMFPRIDWIKSQISAGKSDSEINKLLQSRTNITFGGVTSSPRERSAGLYASSDMAQYLNCEIMSTQDTIGINSGRMYFKDCKLGGTTDYICGSATAVFENCELYANAGEGGDSATITAPSNPIESEGYLFYNCHITGTDLAQRGNLGRPWSAEAASANYINTKIDNCGSSSGYSGKSLIGDAGWTSMGCKPEDARFHEYNSVDPSGNAVSTSSRTKGTLLDEWTMLRYNPLIFTKGSDGWDPSGITEKYAGVNNVLDTTTIDTSNVDTNVVDLPQAPSGYEYNWESISEYATVNASKTKMTVIRPANGEEPIKATVKLYVRDSSNKTVGVEKSIEFLIQPTNDVTNVFTVSGNTTLSKASDTDQTVTIQYKAGDAVIKTTNVVIPAGQTTVAYTSENIPVGSYVADISISNKEYTINPSTQNVSGTIGQNVSMNVSVTKMETIKVESSDFSATGYTPNITSATGFSGGKYTVTGSETANLGEAGNVVYKVTKDEGKTVAAKTGVSFNVKSMLPSGKSFDNTKTIKFSYDYLMETTDYFPSDYSYFDLATSTSNAGADAVDQTRFIRWGVHKGWGQMNFFGSTRTRINGDNTQFNKNNNMANKWFRIVGDIDLVNNVVTTTLYDRDWKTGDAGTYMLNSKSFTIAAPDAEGSNPNYPTSFDLSKLYFNVYMDKGANTTNKMEYYFDNISVEFQDYE